MTAKKLFQIIVTSSLKKNALNPEPNNPIQVLIVRGCVTLYKIMRSVFLALMWHASLSWVELTAKNMYLLMYKGFG